MFFWPSMSSIFQFQRSNAWYMRRWKIKVSNCCFLVKNVENWKSLYLVYLAFLRISLQGIWLKRARIWMWPARMANWPSMSLVQMFQRFNSLCMRRWKIKVSNCCFLAKNVENWKSLYLTKLIELNVFCPSISDVNEATTLPGRGQGPPGRGQGPPGRDQDQQGRGLVFWPLGRGQALRLNIFCPSIQHLLGRQENDDDELILHCDTATESHVFRYDFIQAFARWHARSTYLI